MLPALRGHGISVGYNQPNYASYCSLYSITSQWDPAVCPVWLIVLFIMTIGWLDLFQEGDLSVKVYIFAQIEDDSIVF